MSPDRFHNIMQCSKWKQFSLGINSKISPTEWREGKLEGQEERLAMEGKIRGRLGKGREYE